MGSGISVSNEQALECLKNEIKNEIKKSLVRNLSSVKIDKYERILEFFRKNDKKKDCNPEFTLYRNWLIDCEYDRLIKQL